MTLPMPSGLPFPDAKLLSRQGMRPRRTHWHNGIDLAQVIGGRSVRGTPGGPIAVGTVEDVCYAGSTRCSGYGNTILVKHDDDLYSFYAHLDKIYVEEGDEVFPGDHMYDVGVTFGTPDDPTRTLPVPHLHLEILHAGFPFGANNTAARYDVLRELAAAGLGLLGDRLAYLDPFDYAEPLLAANVAKARSFGAVPKELDWPTWPLYVGFGGLVLVGGLIALAPGRDRQWDAVRRMR
jgi:murein DD-endopeptidase MepM/ murein hydrolase activator NlpD